MNGDERRLRTLSGPEDSQAELNLSYRRLRSPRASGQSLQIPPLTQTVSNWNDRDSATPEIEIGGLKLSSLKQQGRSELLQLAGNYSSQYRDIDMAERNAQSIVMSGHQPLLFHPGVWFKNFALSSLSSAVDAMPVNLVVDNDVCGSASIKCPVFEDGKASTGLIDIDGPAAAVPHEVRAVVDDNVFASFADRASDQVQACFAAFGKTDTPLVSRLWPHVKSARDSLRSGASLGAILAAGRHRLEQEAGLQTLEVPVSSVAQSEAFCHFAAAILTAQDRFNESYNARLVEYRQLHGIRSTSHPVPELERNDGWLESPFWVWSNDRPQRERLFVNKAGKMITLTNRAGWKLEVEAGDLPSALSELAQQHVAIRPRALSTTLYSRLVLSDLFLHGIGGAKYDQLTDLITSDFFGVTLPSFSTLTATMRLPLGVPVVGQADCSEIRQQLRQRRFHPDRFINSTEVDLAEAATWIDQKRTVIGSKELTPSERHEAINEANSKLQPFVAEQAEMLHQELANVHAQIHNSKILNSREYSFCLFPDALIDDLKRMASCS
ncbi:hypothetical protein N9L06_03330 [Mariniblastus sp.]|nr:hypothetical protein [Mariniblastus sp.]